MTEHEMLELILQKVTGLDENVTGLDENFTSSENMILKEIDRVQEHLESDVQKVQKNMEELQQYYRIAKLENDNTSLLLKMYNDMQKEIAELKAKIA